MMARKVLLIFALFAAAVYGLIHFQNEFGIKPLILTSATKAYEVNAGKPGRIELLGSNIPFKFVLAMPGQVKSLARVNNQTIEIIHDVEFYGVTPIISLITGKGTVRVRITEETRQLLKQLK